MEEGLIREALITLLIGIVPVIVGVLARALLQVLQEKLGTERYYKIKDMIETFIAAAEQTTGIDTPEEKKAYVLHLALLARDRLGLDLSDTEIDALIEGILKQWKAYNKPLLAG